VGQNFTVCRGHRFSVLDRKGNQITQLQIWPQPKPAQH